MRRLRSACRLIWVIIGALAPLPINNHRNGKLSLVQGPLSMVNLQPLLLTARENHYNTSQVLFQWPWMTSFSLWGHPVWRSFPGEVHAGCHLCTSVPTHLSLHIHHMAFSAISATCMLLWGSSLLLAMEEVSVSYCWTCVKGRAHMSWASWGFSGTEAFKTDTS